MKKRELFYKIIEIKKFTQLKPLYTQNKQKCFVKWGFIIYDNLQIKYLNYKLHSWAINLGYIKGYSNSKNPRLFIVFKF